MKTPTLAACAALAFSISSHSIADERKPAEERPKAPEGLPAKRGEGERPAARENARPAAPREGERRPEAGPQRGFPGAELLTQEEREKLRAAQAKVNDDAGVKIAEAALRDASNALRTARDAAIVASDPSLEPVLKKLKEAREAQEKEAGARRRVEGDQPRRREGSPEGARRSEPAPQK